MVYNLSLIKYLKNRLKITYNMIYYIVEVIEVDDR